VQASVVQNGAGRLWCRANGHGVQASVVQCIGAAWCWEGVVQASVVQGECGAERVWCRANVVQASVVQGRCGAGWCMRVWCR
jgi:hypothetical protein